MLPQIDERRQQVAAYFIPTSLNGKSGIRSATLFLFTCFRSAPLILLSFLLFLCRYHAGVANNRFIGCLVGLLLLLFIVSFASRLPTRSNPTIDEKKIRKHATCFRIFWRKEWDSNPRCVAAYLISSQGRYDHFDTFP